MSMLFGVVFFGRTGRSPIDRSCKVSEFPSPLRGEAARLDRFLASLPPEAGGTVIVVFPPDTSGTEPSAAGAAADAKESSLSNFNH